MIFMINFGRSGGTLLNRILAALPNTVVMSEVHPLGGGWGKLKDKSPTTIQSLSDGKSLEAYRNFIAAGVCPEQARMVLPQSMMTEWYWSGTLHAFEKMCGLRLKDDVQEETRQVAEAIEDFMMELYPISWEALRMYADG